MPLTNRLLFSNNSGNVGIGTTLPDVRFHVVNSSAETIFARFQTTGSASAFIGFAGTGATTNYHVAAGSPGPNLFAIRTNDIERMRIDSSGRLLIGTTNHDVGGSVAGIQLGATGRALFSTDNASGVGADEPLYIDRRDTSGDGIAILLARHGYYKAGIGVLRGGSAAAAGSMYFATGLASNAGFAERMRITSDGNVGIGDTAPIYPMVIRKKPTSGEEARMLVIGNTEGGGTFMFLGTSTTSGGYSKIQSITTEGISYGNLILNSDGGNVGIGTTSPGYKLEITSTNNGLKINTSAANSGSPSIDLLDGSVDTVITSSSGLGIGLIGTYSSHPFSFYTANSEKMRITSSGNVGIGTTSPGAKLQIGSENEINLTQQSLFVQGSKVGYAGYGGLPQNQLLIYDDTASTAGSGGAIGFGANTGSSQRTWIAAIESRRDSATNDASNYAGSLVFYTRPAQAPPEERVRITSAGNVGIGTTDPAYKLHVKSGLSSGAIALFEGSSGRYIYTGTDGSGHYIEQTGTSAAERVLRIQNSNGSGTYTQFFIDGANQRIYTSSNVNVGIGIASPWSKLWVERNGIDLASWSNEDASSIAHFTLAGADSHVRLHFGTLNVAPYAGYIQATFDNTPDNSGTGSSGLEPLLINPMGGDVGIGTTSPAFTSGTGLEIQRSGTATLRLDSGTFATELRGYSDGTGLFQLSAGYLDLGTDGGGTTRLRITSTGNVGIGTTGPRSKLTVNGPTSVGPSGKLSFIGLDINSQDTPTYIKITTTIPSESGGADFTVNIKGFRYGGADTTDLKICWHWYLGTFYQPTISSSGSWAPTVRLSAEGGFVAIVLSSPAYWPKLYVESMYSSFYSDQYTTGWTWSDADATGSPIVTLSYKSNFGNNIIANSTGLGVGTSPSVKLHVAGSSVIANNTGIDPDSYTNAVVAGAIADGSGWGVSSAVGGNAGTGNSWAIGHNGNYLYYAVGNGSANDSFASYMVTGGANRHLWLVPTSGGNVGIGVPEGTSPGQRLSVVHNGNHNPPGLGNNGGIFGLWEKDSNNAGDYGIMWGVTGNGHAWQQVQRRDGGAQAYDLWLQPSGGNVGIGMTSPQKRLDVNGSANSFAASFGVTMSAGAWSGIHFGYSESSLGNDAYKKSGLVFERTDNNNQGGNASGKIHILLNNNSSTSATLSDSVVTIDSDENGTIGSVRMGIGTTAPNSRLSVNGGDIEFSRGTGNLGNRYLLLNKGTSNDGGILFRRDNANEWQLVNANPDKDFWFYSYGASSVSMAIKHSNGNVGIGTTSPVEKLDVNGNIKATGFRTIQLVRSLGATVNSTVEIGNWNIGNGAHTFQVFVTASLGGYSVTKSYIVSTFYNQTSNNWRSVGPISNPGPYQDDFALEIKVDNTLTYLRLRKTLNSIYGGNHQITIIGLGEPTDTFTATSATGTDSSSLSVLSSTPIAVKDGNVGIGTINPSTALDVNGTATATTFNSTSDARLKENFEAIPDPLQKLAAIRGLTYNFRDDERQRRHAGILAQDLLEVLPEAVSGSEDTNYTVGYNNVVALLVEAVKELKAEVDRLKKNNAQH